jgi:hypothetical protein
VWKHTLADLFPPSPETALQNQEVKSSVFRSFPLNISGHYPDAFPIGNNPLSTVVSESSWAVQGVVDNPSYQPTIMNRPGIARDWTKGQHTTGSLSRRRDNKKGRLPRRPYFSSLLFQGGADRKGLMIVTFFSKT